MHIDKLDGRVTNKFFDQKSEEWRREQLDIRWKIEMHENANCSYIDEGVRILELSLKGRNTPSKLPKTVRFDRGSEWKGYG